MAVYKCKMCGGTLEINNNESVAICEYCDTKQTLPKSYTRVPACHRTSYDVIFAEPSYLSAIANADVHQKAVYEEEARGINDIQGSILDVVKNEKPFDVFTHFEKTESIVKYQKNTLHILNWIQAECFCL